MSEFDEQRDSADIEAYRLAVRQLLEQISKRDDRLKWLQAEQERLHQELAEKDKAIGDLSAQLREREQSIGQLQAQMAQLQAEQQRLRQELAEKDKAIGDLSAQLREREQSIGQLQAEVAQLKAEQERLHQELAEIKSSTAWAFVRVLWIVRLWIAPHGSLRERVLKLGMRRLRQWRRWVHNVWQGVQTGLIRILSKVYRGLPLPQYRKKQIKDFIFSHCRILFQGTAPYQQWERCRHSTESAHSLKTSVPLFLHNVPHAVTQIEKLIFPKVKDPLVSIIIPTYNNWRYTYACLKSILERTKGLYEIIVADDGSKDETHLMLKQISGIHIIRNAQNVGFIRNCNNAAKSARGRYLVFLNNDTEVTDGWLEAMLGVFERFARVGVVGPKLLYPDGRVQEAGSIMFRNGWSHPYGRGGDPSDPEFNYVKEVDCITGACLMVDKELFFSLGKFDERYAPAHFEEFDLEFAIRQAGYRVMYQPKAVVIHHGSATIGEQARDRLSTTNHEKFCEKWKEVLESLPASTNEVFLARDRSRGKRVILFIDDKLPDYDQHAGGLTIYQYLQLFTDMGFKVIFMPDNLYPTQPYTEELQQLGIEVLYGNIDFKRYVAEYGKYLHYVWLARPDVAIKYIDMIKEHSSAKVWYYTHDLHHLRETRRYAIEGRVESLKEAERLKKIEEQIFRKVDLILTPSDYEAEIIAEMVPNQRVLVIPPFFYDFTNNDVREGEPFENRKDILFLGGFGHPPNVDAVRWFILDIFPKIRERLPHVTFCIAGSNPPPELYALQDEGIVVKGYVKDLDPLFERARVFVAPLRYGAGIKVKILISMVHGVPVVTTSIGNEGLNLSNEKEAFVVDDPEEFAKRVVEIYTNKNLWYQLSRESRQYIKRNFSRERALEIMKKAMALCCSP